MKKIYNLNLHKEFDSKLSALTEEFLLENINLEIYAKEFKDYSKETNMTISEYLLEIIMLSTLWESYGLIANNISNFLLKILIFIYSLKKTNFLGKFIYTHTIGIFHSLIYTRKQKNPAVLTIDSYKKLCLFCSSVDDLKEESLRSLKWLNFMIEKNCFSELMNESLVANKKVMAKIHKEFQNIFTNLEEFRYNSLKEKIYKENFMLTQKSKEEYYLNLFAAEIMNKAMEAEAKKLKKLIIVPACLCKPSDKTCKKESLNGLYRCRFCNDFCQVAVLTKKYENVFIVPHSTDFKLAIKEIKKAGNVAVLGIACIQNLLEGGYGLKRANIISQCAILQYPSCRHFSDKAFVNTLDMKAVEKIMN